MRSGLAHDYRRKHPRQRLPQVKMDGLAQVELLIAFPTSLLTFPVAFTLAIVLGLRACSERALLFHLLAWGKLLGGLRPLLFLDLARCKLLGGLRPLLFLDLPRGKLLGGLRLLLFLLSNCGRTLRRPLLIVPPHYGITRLITVTLDVKRLLLLH